MAGSMPEPRAVGEEIVAQRLALRPVAGIVDTNDARGPRDADERAEVDQQARQPRLGLESAVDHHPVHPDRMPDQQRRRGQREEQRGSLPRCHRQRGDCACDHRRVP
jgi:hypothetical protein